MTISLLTMYKAQPNSPSTTISGALDSGSTSITVTDSSVFSDGLTVPFLATLGYDTLYSQTVLITNISENVLTVTRGVDGVAAAWESGTAIARMFTAKDLNDVQSNIGTLNTGKQDTITGTSGQIVGINSDGIAQAMDAPPMASIFELTIPTSAWSDNQATVSNENFVTNGFTYIVSPTADSYMDYFNAIVYAQEVTVSGQITFSCTVQPTSNLNVSVLKVGVS